MVGRQNIGCQKRKTFCAWRVWNNENDCPALYIQDESA